ncbi:MAG TPA: YbhB/YbcL family Raf kinase inhibitor-like protein [Thermomicrobiales bacterium]|jgi:Raf kinase inhibitor-like YbhB/YbcL family protein|nr:YbhB/YbcL family Raf kinase inhibitor-like protein [Thermomicrobiales bacterium]
MTFKLTSSAFGDQGTIPTIYTCDGRDISPPLSWSDAPGGAQGYALIVEDPDAPHGTFDHWIVYNMPGTETGLREAMPSSDRLENGALQGRNSFGNIGYGGPCPPGGTHRYFFRLFALDAAILDIPTEATKERLIEAMRPHVLAEAQLMGRYTRQK